MQDALGHHRGAARHPRRAAPGAEGQLWSDRANFDRGQEPPQQATADTGHCAPLARAWTTRWFAFATLSAAVSLNPVGEVHYSFAHLPLAL